MRKQFGEAVVQVNRKDGRPIGSRIKTPQGTFELPHWPSRIKEVSVRTDGGGIDVLFDSGQRRILDPRYDAIQESSAGGSMGGKDPKAHGKIRYIVRSFGKWAKGKHHVCVARISTEHPEVAAGKNLNALCAWLKDQWAGTTKWRGTGAKNKAEDAAIRAKAGATAKSRFTHAMPPLDLGGLDSLVESVQAMTGESVEDVLAEMGVSYEGDPYEALFEHDARLSEAEIGEVETEIAEALYSAQVPAEQLERWLALHGDGGRIRMPDNAIVEAAQRVVAKSASVSTASELDRRVLECLRTVTPQDFDPFEGDALPTAHNRAFNETSTTDMSIGATPVVAPSTTAAPPLTVALAPQVLREGDVRPTGKPRADDRPFEAIYEEAVTLREGLTGSYDDEFRRKLLVASRGSALAVLEQLREQARNAAFDETFDQLTEGKPPAVREGVGAKALREKTKSDASTRAQQRRMAAARPKQSTHPKVRGSTKAKTLRRNMEANVDPVMAGLAAVFTEQQMARYFPQEYMPPEPVGNHGDIMGAMADHNAHAIFVPPKALVDQLYRQFTTLKDACATEALSAYTTGKELTADQMSLLESAFAKVGTHVRWTKKGPIAVAPHERVRPGRSRRHAELGRKSGEVRRKRAEARKLAAEVIDTPEAKEEETTEEEPQKEAHLEEKFYSGSGSTAARPKSGFTKPSQRAGKKRSSTNPVTYKPKPPRSNRTFHPASVMKRKPIVYRSKNTKRAAPGALRSGGYIRRGQSGSQGVAHVQKALRSLGYLHTRQKIGNSGGFGPRTERAVRRFQKANGLQVDGVVGRQTITALRQQGSTHHRRAARARARTVGPKRQSRA